MPELARLAPFVGSERLQLVRELEAAFSQVQADESRPRLVTLEAQSGWGKTRLVQELYTRLAAGQAEPAYWPPSIVEASIPDHALGVDGVRKLIYPEILQSPTQAGDPVPTYFWWGITATRRQSGLVPIQALAEDFTQIAVHQSALDRRFASIAGLRLRTSRAIRTQGRSIATDAAGAVAGETVITGATAAGATVAGPAGAAIGFGVGLILKHIAALRDGPATSSDVTDASDSSRGDLVEPLAASLTEFARAGIPLLIVVEDLHTADTSLVDLLVRLLNGPSAPILIIGTCWPGLLDEADRPAHRLLTEVPGPSIERLEQSRLLPLDVEEQIALVREILPDVDPRDARLLARHFVNPLALQIGLQLPVVDRAIRDGTLLEVLVHVPRDVRGVFRATWDELPEELRRALTLAAISAPSGATPLGAEPLVESDIWDPDLITRAAAATPWLQEELDRLEERLSGAPVRYGWARRVDEWLRTWLEPVQHEIASASRAGFCTTTELRTYHEALAASIELSEEWPPSRRLAAAQLLTTLAADGSLGWTPSTLRAADLVITSLEEQPDVASMRRLVTLIDRMPDTGDERAFERREARVRAVGRLGRPDLAVDALDLLVKDRERVAPPDDALLQSSRSDLATWLGRSGDIEGAVEQFKALLEDRIRLLGSAHPDTLRTRSNLATWLGRSGDIEAALRVHEELLDDRIRILGPEHPDTLRTRSSVARWRGRSGAADDAARELAAVLAERIRVLGADHPETLRTRTSLLNWRMRAGETGLVREIAQLVEDHLRILGPDHPQTRSAEGLSESDD
jgi:hypothetical protein